MASTDESPPLSPSPGKRGSAGAKQGIRLTVIAAVLGLSLWYVLRGVDWPALWGTVLSVNIAWILAAVASTMIAHVVRAQRWRVLIPDGGAISLLNATSATVIGYMMSNVIPRSGELGRPFLLARREGRSMSALLATVVVERILDLVTLALIFVLLLFMEAGRLEKILREGGFPNLSVGGIFAAVVPLLVALIFLMVLAVKTPLGDRMLDLLGRWFPERLVTKLRSLLQEFRTGVAFQGGGALVMIAFWTLVIWLGYALSLYFGFRAFGFDRVYGLGLWEMIPMLAITTVAISLAPTPGAFGFYHATCKAALMILFGVPGDQAVAFALVMHAAPYLTVMIAGALFSLRESVSFGDVMRGTEKARSGADAVIDPVVPH